MPEHLHIRTPPALRRRLEQLAEARRTTLSGAIRAAVMEATVPSGDIPSEKELFALLGEAARAGSVPAMRELLNHYRERDTEADNPLKQFDELAQRRTRR